jgi:UPF0755 protein
MNGRENIILRISNCFENIVLLSLLSLLYYLTIPVSTPKNLLLPSGSIKTIITQLQTDGCDVGRIDALLLRGLGPPQSGWIYLGKNSMNRLEFLHKLGKASGRFKKITLIPGETTVIFLEQLAETMDKNGSALMREFLRQSPYKEAGILADTYNIPLHYNERRIIEYLVNLSRKRYKTLAEKAGISYDPSTWKRILIIASIIQKEAANRDEMPKVSSVIFNRLKRNMRLQMDGTLNYGRYSHVRITPDRIRDDNSTYNTYRHKGLPDAPVCNVSAAAIMAALHPEHTDYLYFIRNERGTHDFTSAYRTHIRKVREKRRELRQKKRTRKP